MFIENITEITRCSPLMSSKLGEGSSGVGDHQRSLEKDGRSEFEYGTSCAVVTGGKGVYNQWIHCDLIVIF